MPLSIATSIMTLMRTCNCATNDKLLLVLRYWHGEASMQVARSESLLPRILCISFAIRSHR